jgi:hypothetical protein
MQYEVHPCKVLFDSEWGDDRMFMLVVWGFVTSRVLWN